MVQVVAQKIVVLGTGGTIAGLQWPEKDGRYAAGAVPVASLLKDPHAIETQDVARIDSKDMDLTVWRQLVAAISQALLRADVGGVLVTHGTDTLEDTAWLVACLLGRVTKPVVFTCAMRPADHASPDGPGNLANAMAVLRDEGARNRGVLVVCDGQIHGARHVRKWHGWALNAFTSGDAGVQGWVRDQVVGWRSPASAVECELDFERWSHKPASSGAKDEVTRHAAPSGTAMLDAFMQEPWPWVEMVVASAAADPRTLHALVHGGVQGLVVVGTGAGTVHRQWLAAMAQLPEHLPVVIASPCEMDGMMAISDWPSTGLAPRKAKIMLAMRLLNAGASGA